MENSLKPGIAGEATVLVSDQNLATVYESGKVPVYATPAMIALMEKAAASSVQGLLPEDSTTVGTKVNISHLAASAPGLTIIAKSELVEVDGKRLVFKVEAFDGIEKIGEGLHERFIINTARFIDRSLKKAGQE